jgi:hypothetical protein
MPIRIFAFSVYLVFSVLVAATAQIVKGLGVSVHNFPAPVKSYRLENSGKLYKIYPGSKPADLLTTIPRSEMNRHPHLLGVCDFDTDGTDEYFVKRQYKTSMIEETINTIRIYRQRSKTVSDLASEFQIRGNLLEMYFVKAATSKERNQVIFSMLGGAYWSYYQRLNPDGKSAHLLVEDGIESTEAARLAPGGGSDLLLEDFDGDGIREWVLNVWKGGEDCRCYNPFWIDFLRVLRPAPRGLQQVWPPKDWWIAQDASPTAPVQSGLSSSCENKYAVTVGLWDIDDDRQDEIVAVRDFAANPNPGRTISIYKLRPGFNSFAETSFLHFSEGPVPVVIEGIRRLKERKQIVLQFMDQGKCTSASEHVTMTGGIDYKDGKLTKAWMRDDLNIQVEWKIEDMDADGEDEVLFTPHPTPFAPPPVLQAPLLLKGIETFKPFAPKN